MDANSHVTWGKVGYRIWDRTAWHDLFTLSDAIKVPTYGSTVVVLTRLSQT